MTSASGIGHVHVNSTLRLSGALQLQVLVCHCTVIFAHDESRRWLKDVVNTYAFLLWRRVAKGRCACDALSHMAASLPCSGTRKRKATTRKPRASAFPCLAPRAPMTSIDLLSSSIVELLIVDTHRTTLRLLTSTLTWGLVVCPSTFAISCIAGMMPRPLAYADLLSFSLSPEAWCSCLTWAHGKSMVCSPGRHHRLWSRKQLG